MGSGVQTMTTQDKSINPFRPGAGHMPFFLAGRDDEKKQFQKLLDQTLIMENLVLTGLRGLGKTVLLETFKPMAIASGWLWAGTDLSESSSITEENLAIRILADISVVTSSILIGVEEHTGMGLAASVVRVEKRLDFQTLAQVFAATPGLISDKLKQVLEFVWEHIKQSGKRGIVFAYDEAQNLADHSAVKQFPLSLLLDVFQSIQRKGIPFMLALTGLPTLAPKLVQARTFAERMFRVITLDPLSEQETALAISVPTKGHRVQFSRESVDLVWSITAGYPYFVQYVCRETYDVWVQCLNEGSAVAPIPVDGILRKLDTDFFSGRWAKATDRQRELLRIISRLPNSDGEFTVQDIVETDYNQSQAKRFTGSHVNQMLASLSEAGLIYKNRHGKYSFAVPLMGRFIQRQTLSSISLP
jgi:hypothetical protein